MKDRLKVLFFIFFTVTVISIYCNEAWAAPDADVTDIYNPSSLVALQTFIVTAELFNYGTDGTIPLSMYIDGIYQTTFYIPVYEWSYGWVDVTVTGGLSAGYHTISFCASNCRTEGWTWTGTPDLQLTDIYTPTSLTAGQDTTITARIDNIGNKNAGPFYVDMYIDGQYVAYIDFSSGLPAKSYGEASITILGGLVAGAHNIEFIADVLNEVAESNEGNNQRTETFTWTGGVPDLELTDIYTPTSLTAGQDTTITARITNTGYADAGPFWLDMYIDGQYVASWDFTSGLSARTYSEASVTLTGGLVDGTHNIEFIADVLNEVAESNEGNNNRTEIFTWTGGIPDLELTDIYNPTSLTSGTDTIITAKVTNTGYADANPFYLEMYIDGQFAISVDFSYGLPARSYSEISITITGGLVDGSHDIKFIADVLNEVAESNEGNNQRTETFTWTGGVPDLELTDIYDPTSLESGVSTTITARVTNWGYGDANPFYLDLYIDGNLFAYWDYTSGLPARTYSEASITITGGLPAGAHDIYFVADSLNEVAESNESNNSRTEIWTWTSPVPPICSSEIGQGIGVLGDNKTHIDTCRDSGSGTYYLYDSSRRIDNNPHGHNGQMLTDAGIETSHYSEGTMSDSDNIWNASNQASGVDAHVYAAKVYDYLLSSSKGWWLNSYDNAGSSMYSQVDVSTLANNAQWNGYWVNYFVSSGNNKSTAGALDVVAHEWAHALTENASVYRGVGTTLDYQGWSGALNEAFSDWMGVATEHFYNEDNWTIAEGSITPTPWRDLSNPSAGLRPQPDIVGGTNWYPITGCVPVCDSKSPNYNDCCGVHTNSGVPNKMFYLLSAGGQHLVSNINVQPITIEKAINIAVRANLYYWPHDADFYTARSGMISAAIALFGSANANEVYQVKNAWAAVGVGTIPVVTASASTGGTVSGSGNYSWGSTATVTATPNTGYAFVNWTENENVVSTSASYTFTADGDRTLVANFAPAPQISVTPTSWDFGSFYVGIPSPYKTFTVTNVGLQSLTIQSISITGIDPLEFSYIDMCTGDILSPYPPWNCTIDIQFLPISVGVKNAILSIQSNDPNTPTLNVPLSGTGVTPPIYTLTVTKSGAGSGTVTSSPSGIDCGVNCTETYTEGTPVTLTPISDAGSTFAGWSGDVDCSDGVVTMDADKTCTATFEASSSLPVKIGNTYYSSLQAAYDAAVNGAVIQTQAVVFIENLNINRNISITLQGGYDIYYTVVIGKTSLQGQMTVSNGTVKVKEFVIKK